MMPSERRWHSVAPDSPLLLDALAAPFGTYLGVAVCRTVPGAGRLDAIAPDLLCAVGKTEALTSTLGGRLDLAELWLHAHQVRQLFITGADGLHARVWAELCALGGRVGFDIVFVSAEPARWRAELADLVQHGRQIWLRTDPERPRVQPAVGAPLPDASFPGLPAACAEHLDAAHGARALAIYDECLVAAFDALPPERLHGPPEAAHAFRCALARTPELGVVALAMHAVRAAGLLRGYHISFRDDLGGVAFEDLLTADRLAQLSRLVAPEAAAAGVLAGIGFPSIPEIGDDGGSVKLHGTWHEVPYGAAAASSRGSIRGLSAPALGGAAEAERRAVGAAVADAAPGARHRRLRADRLPVVPTHRRAADGLDQAGARGSSGSSWGLTKAFGRPTSGPRRWPGVLGPARGAETPYATASPRCSRRPRGRRTRSSTASPATPAYAAPSWCASAVRRRRRSSRRGWAGASSAPPPRWPSWIAGLRSADCGWALSSGGGCTFASGPG